MSSSRPRKLRQWLAVLGVATAFIAVFVLWTGPSPNAPAAQGLNSVTASPGASTLQAAEPTPSTSDRSGEPSTAAGPGAFPALPTFGLVANTAGLPKLTVQITVTSDSVIAFFGYVIRGGQPPSHTASDLQSPVVLTATGYSDGIVTRVLAEASPVASFVTCTVRVNGVLKYTSTGHGGYSFAACQG